MKKWKRLRQGEELSETLLNTAEPDGRNNGKPDVDDPGTAHALTAAIEEAKYGDHSEAWSSRDYAAYAMELAQRI
jgi:hypothetical protein